MFGFSGLPVVSTESVYYLRSYAPLFLIGIIGATPALQLLRKRLEGNKFGAAFLTVAEPATLALLLLICTGYLVDGSFNPFLYFRF